jgi:sensor histidine kinase YesM
MDGAGTGRVVRSGAMPTAAPGRGGGRRSLAIILVSAVAVTVLLVVFGVPLVRGSLVWTALVSLVFATTTGGLACLAVPWVAARLGGARFGLVVPAVAAVVVAAALVGTLLGDAMLVLAGIFRPAEFWPIFRFSSRIGIVVALAFSAGMLFYKSLHRRLTVATHELQEAALARERAEKLAADARLASLAAQIHPHFLFNTLNSISALIQEDPPAAERLVERLAALLRVSLDGGGAGTVALAHELSIVGDYLEIEKARFGDRLRYTIDVPEPLRACAVPPLAVHTLVQNSVKHAIAPRPGGGDVRVTARAENAQLVIEVSDSGSGFVLDALPAGHGLDNLRGRLVALFGSEARLSVPTPGARTVVSFSVPRIEGDVPVRV